MKVEEKPIKQEDEPDEPIDPGSELQKIDIKNLCSPELVVVMEEAIENFITSDIAVVKEEVTDESRLSSMGANSSKFALLKTSERSRNRTEGSEVALLKKTERLARAAAGSGSIASSASQTILALKRNDGSVRKAKMTEGCQRAPPPSAAVDLSLSRHSTKASHPESRRHQVTPDDLLQGWHLRRPESGAINLIRRSSSTAVPDVSSLVSATPNLELNNAQFNQIYERNEALATSHTSIPDISTNSKRDDSDTSMLRANQSSSHGEAQIKSFFKHLETITAAQQAVESPLDLSDCVPLDLRIGSRHRSGGISPEREYPPRTSPAVELPPTPIGGANDNESANGFNCAQCSFVARSMPEVEAHFQAEHLRLLLEESPPTEMAFKCHKCPLFSAATSEALELHVASFHQRRCVVSWCTFVTGLKADFIRHAANCHPHLKVFPCPRCEHYVIDTCKPLKAHLETVHKMSSKQVGECLWQLRESPPTPKSAASITVNAVEMGTPRNFSCRECSFGSFDESGLSWHMKNAHDRHYAVASHTENKTRRRPKKCAKRIKIGVESHSLDAEEASVKPEVCLLKSADSPRAEQQRSCNQMDGKDEKVDI